MPDNKPVYYRKMEYPWKKVGSLQGSGFEALTKKYNQKDYELGMFYNGDIQTAAYNGWNRGTRLSLYPLFAMGNDDWRHQQMGTVMFIKGCYNCPGQCLGVVESNTRLVQFQLNGGQFDFVRSSARTHQRGVRVDELSKSRKIPARKTLRSCAQELQLLSRCQKRSGGSSLSRA